MKLYPRYLAIAISLLSTQAWSAGFALNEQSLTSSPPLNGEDSLYRTAISCRTPHLVTKTFRFREVLIPSLPYLSDY